MFSPIVESVIDSSVFDEKKISSSCYAFQVFKNKKGKFLCWLCFYVAPTSQIVVADVESGRIVKKVKNEGFDSDNYGFGECIEDIPKHSCLVGILGSSIFAVHYDDDFRIENKIFTDVFDNRCGCCVYNEERIAYLSENNPHLIHFADFEKREFIGKWECGFDKLCTKVVNSNVKKINEERNDLLFLQCVGRIGSILSGKTMINILDSKKYIMLYEIEDTHLDDIFFDYSGKYLLYSYKYDIITPYSLPQNNEKGLVVENNLKVGIGNVFNPKYGYNNIFFGTDERSTSKLFVSRTIDKGREEFQEIPGVVAGFQIKNNGRDIFSIGNEKDYKVKIFQFLNTKIGVKILDNDEKERIEHLRNMDIENLEGVKLLKISMLGLSEFCLVKLFFLM